MTVHPKALRSYIFPGILLLSIILGGWVGVLWGPDAQRLKPFGDIFLNLIFTAIVPLIFFSVSSAIARAGALGKLGKIIFYMALVFLFTGTVAALLTLVLVKIFPPAQDVYL